MKVRVEADGSMEFEITGTGDAAAAVELVRRLRDAAPPAASVSPKGHLFAAALTPKQADTYWILAAHPDGCHYGIVAERLGLTSASANSRCQYLLELGYATRIRGGVYRVTG